MNIGKSTLNPVMVYKQKVSRRRVRNVMAFLGACLISPVALAIVDVQESYSSVLDNGVTSTLGFSFDGASGNDDSRHLELSEHLTWRTDTQTLMFLGAIETGKSNGTQTDDSGFAHLRYVRRMSDTFSLESYVQYQQDKFVELQRRRLFGAGVRFELWETDSAKRFAVGAGIMQEYERYSSESRDTSELRGNFYASISVPLQEDKLIFSLSSYLQPALNDFANIRTVNNLSLSASIIEALAVKFSLGYHYNGEPVRGVERGDFKYSTSLEYTF